MKAAPHDVTILKNLIFAHFSVSNQFDLLSYCYDNFDKSFFAGLCKSISEEATKGKYAY